MMRVMVVSILKKIAIVALLLTYPIEIYWSAFEIDQV
jgi:hypothetical protein